MTELRLQRVARRAYLVRRLSAQEVHEGFMPPSIAEVEHGSETVRERRLEAIADVGVELLAEVRETS